MAVTVTPQLTTHHGDSERLETASSRFPVALGLGMDGMETTVHSTHLLRIRVLEERKHVSRVYRRELPGLNAD